jgi:hypothetical protein
MEEEIFKVFDNEMSAVYEWKPSNKRMSWESNVTSDRRTILKRLLVKSVVGTLKELNLLRTRSTERPM